MDGRVEFGYDESGKVAAYCRFFSAAAAFGFADSLSVPQVSRFRQVPLRSFFEAAALAHGRTSQSELELSLLFAWDRCRMSAPPESFHSPYATLPAQDRLHFVLYGRLVSQPFRRLPEFGNLKLCGPCFRPPSRC